MKAKVVDSKPIEYVCNLQINIVSIGQLIYCTKVGILCAWCINIVFKVNEYCFVASQYCCSNCVPMFNCESYVSTIFKLCTFTPPHIISQLCLNAITIMPTLTITILLQIVAKQVHSLQIPTIFSREQEFEYNFET